jgi:hypothetical protein
MSKGNAAIRVTSKPKETTRVNYREADKNMRVNTYFGGFLGVKKLVPRQARKEMRQIKVRAMTFRRGPAQVTTAFRDNEHKRQVGTERSHWLQPAEKPSAQGRRRRQEDFGLNVAYGLEEGPTLSCQGLVSCHSLRWQVGSNSALSWPKRPLIGPSTIHIFMAELLGKGKGLLAFSDVWRIEALQHKINPIGGVYTADRTDRDDG